MKKPEKDSPDVFPKNWGIDCLMLNDNYKSLSNVFKKLKKTYILS